MLKKRPHLRFETRRVRRARSRQKHMNTSTVAIRCQVKIIGNPHESSNHEGGMGRESMTVNRTEWKEQVGQTSASSPSAGSAESSLGGVLNRFADLEAGKTISTRCSRGHPFRGPLFYSTERVIHQPSDKNHATNAGEQASEEASVTTAGRYPNRLP